MHIVVGAHIKIMSAQTTDNLARNKIKPGHATIHLGYEIKTHAHHLLLGADHKLPSVCTANNCRSQTRGYAIKKLKSANKRLPPAHYTTKHGRTTHKRAHPSLYRVRNNNCPASNSQSLAQLKMAQIHVQNRSYLQIIKILYI